MLWLVLGLKRSKLTSSSTELNQHSGVLRQLLNLLLYLNTCNQTMLLLGRMLYRAMKTRSSLARMPSTPSTRSANISTNSSTFLTTTRSRWWKMPSFNQFYTTIKFRELMREKFTTFLTFSVILVAFLKSFCLSSAFSYFRFLDTASQLKPPRSCSWQEQRWKISSVESRLTNAVKGSIKVLNKRYRKLRVLFLRANKKS